MPARSLTERIFQAATLALLWAGLAGIPAAFAGVYVLCASDAIHTALRERDLAAPGVRIRVAVLVVLLIGQLPGLHLVLWLLGAAAGAAFVWPLVRIGTGEPVRSQPT